MTGPCPARHGKARPGVTRMSIICTTPTTSGLWRERDHPGGRHFVEVGDLTLESGEQLPDVVISYESWSTLNAARDKAMLIEHALTRDSHVVGPAGLRHPS